MRSSGKTASSSETYRKIGRGVLHSHERGRLFRDLSNRLDLDAHRRAAGNVIDHPRDPQTARYAQIVFDQPTLRRTDVVRRHDQKCVDSGMHGVLRERGGFGKRLRAGSSHDRNAFVCGAHRDVDQRIAFVDGQRRWLGGRAVDDDAVRTACDLQLD